MSKNKGITLISLVVTIIVMLLLAGVAVALAVGPDGVIEKGRASKLDTRYSTIMDRVKLRENDLEIAFERGEENDPNIQHDFFILSLRSEGLLSDDEFDLDKKLIQLGADKNGNYKYVIDIIAATKEDMALHQAKQKLPDADAPGNEHLKNMILVFQTTKSNESIHLPIFGDNNGSDMGEVSGLSVNWDYQKNPNNFVPLSKNHSYPIAGTYEVHIKGKVNESNAVIGGLAPEVIDVTIDNLIKLKSWGENGFSGFHSLKGVKAYEIPLPSRNSFVNTVYFNSTFNTHVKNIPEELFYYAPKLESLSFAFYGCQNLTTIPDNLFDTCHNLNSVYGIFSNCSNLQSIPSNLFSKNQNITDFANAFRKCINLTGYTPQFWLRKNFINMWGCFLNCTNLENYDHIPLNWK